MWPERERSPSYLFLLPLWASLLAALTNEASSDSITSPNEEFEGAFGYSVSGVADLDDDGLGDVIVGAPDEGPGGIMGAGRAYILSAGTGSLLNTLTSPQPETDGDFGISVSGIPDITGDGSGDVVVGAWQENPGLSPASAGRVHIFDGSSGTFLRTLVSPNEQEDGFFGVSVSGIPDVNGDGRGDVVVGADYEDPMPGPSRAGRAYIFDGFTGNSLWTLVSPNGDAEGEFGYSVSGIPDVDGDGRGDVIVGAYQENPGASPTNCGRAYIFSGATGAWLRTLASPTQQADGRFGFSVSGVSDLDGDGRGDVIVGACCEVPPGLAFRAGKAYIFSGATGALLQTLLTPNPDSGAQFGYSVSGIPDTDGDDRGDVVVGALRENPASSPIDSGRAYIFSGASGVLSWTLTSPNEEMTGNFGISVAGISDAGADQRGDVIIGAWKEDPGASPVGAGRAYVFDGAHGTLMLVKNSVRNWPLYR